MLRRKTRSARWFTAKAVCSGFVYSCILCLFNLYKENCTQNIFLRVTNAYCITWMRIVWLHCLRSPQEFIVAGPGRPNGRRGNTKCRAPVNSILCCHLSQGDDRVGLYDRGYRLLLHHQGCYTTWETWWWKQELVSKTLLYWIIGYSCHV